jgi:hypothetical protein
LHHALNLFFAGCAESRHGILHLCGRVLHDSTTARRRQRQHHATGLTNAHRRAGVVLEEHPLHRNGAGTKLLQQRKYIGM